MNKIKHRNPQKNEKLYTNINFNNYIFIIFTIITKASLYILWCLIILLKARIQKNNYKILIKIISNLTTWFSNSENL